jgi:hypothetical protein
MRPPYVIARPPRWLIAAILADGLVLGTLISRGFGILTDGGEIVRLVCGALAFAIYATVAVWLWFRPSAHTYGLAIGLYAIGMMPAGGWLALLALGLGMSSTLAGDDLRILGSAAALFLAQFALAAAAYRAADRAGVQSRRDVARAGALQLSVTGVVLLIAALWVGMRFEQVAVMRGNHRFGTIESAVFRVQGCAAQYASTYPDQGYPLTLAAMGPGGQNCVDGPTAAGRDRNGVAITYEAEYDDRARVPTFIITARGRAYGEAETIVGDPSGLARAGSVVFGESLFKVSFARNCLELFRAWFPDRPFPASLVDLARAMKGRNDGPPGARLFGGCTLIGDSSSSEAERVAEFVTRGAHRLSYRPNGKDDYVLEVRPIRYGETAVRSYTMRRGGAVHVTLLDRPATDDDPQVTACEYEVDEDCVFLPGAPPVVAFVHDTVVVRGLPYRLAAGDPPPPAPALDPSLHFSFECYAGSPLQRSLPSEIGADRQRTCPQPPSWRKDGRVVVRLWTIDRTGAVSVHEDTLPVVGATNEE